MNKRKARLVASKAKEEKWEQSEGGGGGVHLVRGGK